MRLIFCATTECNRRCRQCTVAPLRAADPEYHATLAEVERLVAHTVADGRRFDTIDVTGGDPLLWRNLRTGLRLLKSIADTLCVYTNGLAADDVDERSLAAADSIRVSEYPDTQGIGAIVAEAFPDTRVRTVQVPAHRVNPTGPVGGALPPNCGCPGYYYYRGMVWRCGGLVHTAYREGADPFECYDMYAGVHRGYLDCLETMGYPPHCNRCGSNKKIDAVAPREAVVNDA